jgi:hypothetical protein
VVTFAAAVYVRSIAAPFLVGLAIACAWQRGWRRAVQPALIGLALVAPWIVHVFANRGAMSPALADAGFGSYGAFYAQGLSADPFTMLYTVPVVNGPLIVQALGQALLGWHWAPQALEVALGLAIVMLTGWLPQWAAMPFVVMALFTVFQAPTWPALEAAVVHVPGRLKLADRVGIYNLSWAFAGPVGFFLSGFS